MGDGLTAALAHRHMVAGARAAVDRPVDGPLRTFRRTPDEGEIAALERLAAAAVAGELRRQRPVSAVVLRHHHQAGRILIEPVHDAGPPLAADAGETYRRNGRSAR